MIKVAFSSAEDGRTTGRQPRLGTAGRLAVVVWSLALLLFVPSGRLALAAGVTLAVNAFLYPHAVRRLFRWRWLLFGLLLILPTMFWSNGAGQPLWGIPVSLSGLQTGLTMLLRALVIILTIDGFSSAVDISEVAGLLERVGLPGLGFSLGVAVNLLPVLRTSSQNVWRTLQMRGGFRRRWWRALQLFLITVVANALHRAEEIALAAEVKAFSASQPRSLPVKIGEMDVHLALALVGCWLLFVFVP